MQLLREKLGSFDFRGYRVDLSVSLSIVYLSLFYDHRVRQLSVTCYGSIAREVDKQGLFNVEATVDRKPETVCV